VQAKALQLHNKFIEQNVMLDQKNLLLQSHNYSQLST